MDLKSMFGGGILGHLFGGQQRQAAGQPMSLSPQQGGILPQGLRDRLSNPMLGLGMGMAAGGMGGAGWGGGIGQGLGVAQGMQQNSRDNQLEQLLMRLRAGQQPDGPTGVY